MPEPLNVIMAIDLGTGSSRAALVDAALRVRALHQAPVRLIEPRPGWVEQDPAGVLRAARIVIREAAATATGEGWRVAGLSFSNAISSLLAVDEWGRPLMNALTWADARAGGETRELAGQAAELHKRCGTPVHAGYWPAKLIWLRRRRPEVFEKARRWMGIKDFVVHALTGVYVTDAGNAAATGLLDQRVLGWDGPACALAGVDVERLLPVQPTTFVLPGLTPSAALDLGLPEATPIILGGGDGPLANLGSGVIAPDRATSTIGSSGACRTALPAPILGDPRARIWSYPMLPGLWAVGGAINSGGLIVDWFLRRFYPKGPAAFPEMLAEAARVKAGSDGLLFLPYLYGERAPLWDEKARGAWVGLTRGHTRGHLARSVLEGTVYALYDVFRMLEEYAPGIGSVRVSGGYARSPLWLQIQADLFGRELEVMDSPEGSALGAAMLGLLALGILPDIHSAASLPRVKETVRPIPESAEIYRNWTPLYGEVYRALKPEFG